MYSLKMFTLERVRARHFTKAWSFVQGAEAIPILIGVPITGYINQSHPKAGYYLSFVFTMIGTILLFFVGYAKKPETPVTSFTAKMTPNECLCPNTISPQIIPDYRYNNYNQNHFNHYEHMMNQYNQQPPRYIDKPHRHSFKIYREPNQYRQRDGLHKSISYAAHMNFPDPPVHCITDQADFMNCTQYYKPTLRSSKSVPEGLQTGTRWDQPHYSNWGSYRRPIIRNVQVIEQITTSV